MARCRSNSIFSSKTKHHLEKGSSSGESGCIEPVIGKKTKCILRIVPRTQKCKTLKIAEDCKIRRE